MRLTRLVSLASFVLIPSIALAACGGDDPEPILLDAAVPDAVPPPPDAEPCPDDECDGVCVNFDNAEDTCGDCTTTCGGGQACGGGLCACVEPYLPADPTFGFSQATDMLPGAGTGFGVFQASGVPSVLVVAYPDPGVILGDPYPLMELAAGGAPSPPFIATGYNVNLSSFQADLAHFATAGTVIFDSICEDAAGVPTGFTGHAIDVVFSPVAGLMNPTIDTESCEAFKQVSFDFALGTPCPIPPQK